jgi:hypothetical protein
MGLAAKPSRRIGLPIDCEQYRVVVQDAGLFRAVLEANFQQYPELFPDEMDDGYTLHDIRASRKLSELRLRRIRLKPTGAVYRVVPSFVLPYRMGYTDTVE